MENSFQGEFMEKYSMASSSLDTAEKKGNALTKKDDPSSLYTQEFELK